MPAATVLEPIQIRFSTFNKGDQVFFSGYGPNSLICVSPTGHEGFTFIFDIDAQMLTCNLAKGNELSRPCSEIAEAQTLTADFLNTLCDEGWTRVE